MVLFNHATREMTAKIVYYGPGLCGKTTNLLIVFDKLDPKSRGKMLSLATRSDRTLFFDLLPVEIGRIGPFNLKIQLYTVPGQVFYNETRKLVLKGADAVVFVVDSQASMIDSNRDSFQNLIENLEENQIDPNDIPIIIQYNKRDIPGVPSAADLARRIGLEGFPSVEAAALQGAGVMETFKMAVKVTTRHLIGKYQGRPVRPAQPVIQAQQKDAELSSTSTLSFPMTPPPKPATEKDYDGMKEVTVEELLEGRQRPATLSGNVAAPPLPISVDDELPGGPDSDDIFAGQEDEEIDEMGTEDLVAVETESPFSIVADPEPFHPETLGADVDEEVEDSAVSVAAYEEEGVPFEEPLPLAIPASEEPEPFEGALEFQDAGPVEEEIPFGVPEIPFDEPEIPFDEPSPTLELPDEPVLDLSEPALEIAAETDSVVDTGFEMALEDEVETEAILSSSDSSDDSLEEIRRELEGLRAELGQMKVSQGDLFEALGQGLEDLANLVRKLSERHDS